MSNSMFKKIVEKKKKEGKDISDIHSSAKSSVLSDLMDHLGSMGVDKIKGMKKLSIQSDSREGLKAGIKKASDLMEKDPAEAMENDPEMSKRGSNNPDAEGSQMEGIESAEDSEEECEDPQSELQRLKARIAELEK